MGTYQINWTCIGQGDGKGLTTNTNIEADSREDAISKFVQRFDKEALEGGKGGMNGCTEGTKINNVMSPDQYESMASRD